MSGISAERIAVLIACVEAQNAQDHQIMTGWTLVDVAEALRELQRILAPLAPRQRDYIQHLTSVDWKVSAITIARDGQEETLRAP